MVSSSSQKKISEKAYSLFSPLKKFFFCFSVLSTVELLSYILYINFVFRERTLKPRLISYHFFRFFFFFLELHEWFFFFFWKSYHTLRSITVAYYFFLFVCSNLLSIYMKDYFECLKRIFLKHVYDKINRFLDCIPRVIYQENWIFYFHS